MRNFNIYIFFVFIIISFSCSKSCFSKPQDSLGNHLWFIELVGVNYGISFNYEYIFANDALLFDKISLRTGVGGLVGFVFLHIGSPLMINFLLGKKHCFELGTGVLFDYAPKQVEYDYPTQAIKFIGNIGYRYVSDSGFIFKLVFVPFYWGERGIIPLFGISFGHYF
ncbi:MAG: hypothetical protein A2475_06070 [Ignavibacteria bacterium RIFOXYC2_FULL_35_21]|nr:MAG: hypothetical protein A2X63_05275 [Ignavibacteria bacterium GWA2_35_8]OGU86154.1 MAG: hypothetical protein A2220_17305 [Ignavibacteria bacterium RIFOXYA2_FULL_35_10]OGV23491.1 MAG: hypothetical protein A2475_06070 [Ignavibacteria bacterium RIFOXYC2_FULL_35_21]